MRLALQEHRDTQAHLRSVLNLKHPNDLIYKYFKPDVSMHSRLIAALTQLVGTRCSLLYKSKPLALPAFL